MSNRNSIEAIYSMLTPANLIAAQKVASNKTESTIARLLDILYGAGNRGVYSIEDLRKNITNLLSGEISDDDHKEIKRILRFYSTGPQVGIDKLAKASLLYSTTDPEPKLLTSMKELFNSSSDLKKDFAIIMSNTPFINPAMRNAEKTEIFLNFIPSLFASRMVPYFEAEFEYVHAGLSDDQRSSQIKFLLGNDSSATSEINKKMINSISARFTGKKPEQIFSAKYAGMEMFTSPQTLINPNTAQSGKYTQVLDPFRPFATIENFEISVESTVGLFSYKKGAISIKVHDKSRLSEMSEFIQPQLNNNSILTVKYGWIYPEEANEQNNDGSSTYADFINNNFLIQEQYTVINSSYSFDQTGQVTINLQIAMRSANELRSIKHSEDDNSALRSLEELKRIGKQIGSLLKKLQPDESPGTLKEIRGYQIIEAAQTGTFPEDLSALETRQIITNLKKSLLENKVNPTASAELIAQLETYYIVDNINAPKKFNKLEAVKNESLQAVKKRFEDVVTGPDPFLPSEKTYKKLKDEIGGTAEHPFVSLINEYNKNPEDAKNVKKGAPLPKVNFKKNLVSFGKLFSVFAGQVLQSLDNIDEFQVYFYSFNEKAGLAASTNIAEFPIEMPILLEHYREHVERYGTTDITLENFLMLVRDSQIHDTRALAYGFREYFMPFEPGQEAVVKKEQEQAYENARAGFSKFYGPFKKPVIEFYAETIVKNDIESSDTNKKSILRLHIFDKNMTPHKTASAILRSDTTDNPSFIEVSNTFVQENSKNINAQSNEDKLLQARELITKNENGSISIALNKGFSNDDIKKKASRLVPTIIIGCNGTMVKSADLSSNQDSLLSTIQMMNQNKGIRSNGARPSGAGAAGLPLRVIPGSLSLTTAGCPTLSYGQQFFVDFSTGTTIDNIYNVTGLKHSISPGRFESTITMTYGDAYGKFEGAPTEIDYITNQLKSLDAISKKAEKQ
jgi:hypothetical protein